MGGSFPPAFFCGQSHACVERKQLFEALGIVFEAAAPVDAPPHFVIAHVGMAQVFGHVFSGLELGNRCREVHFAREKNIFGTFGQVGFIFLGKHRHREGIPAKRIGIGKIGSHANTDLSNPHQMQARSDYRDSP